MRAWATASSLVHADSPRAAEALETASFVLWSLTGRRYSGIYSITEAYSTYRSLGRGVAPALVHGQLVNMAYPPGNECRCNSCGVFHQFRLRQAPVRYILDVSVDGTALERSDWVVINRNTLGFLTPLVCGANCVVVTYQYGSDPPPGGAAAVRRLADEIIASMENTECALPQRVTSVSRQGVSWTLLDPQEFLEQGRVGIYEIDMFIKAANPARALMPAKVFSPDIRRGFTMTQQQPPPSAFLRYGDQPIIPGFSARWLVSDDYALNELLTNGSSNIELRIGGQPVAGALFTDSSDSTELVVDIPAEATEEPSVTDGAAWEIYVNGVLSETGTVRIINVN